MGCAPTLNYDILAMITSFASPDATLKLMQSCRFFYHEGPKVLLGDGLAIGTEVEIPIFVRFMSAENGSRYRYLTGFYLYIQEVEDLDAETFRPLVEVFRNNAFTSLRTLALHESEPLWEKVSDLAPVFSTLSTVTTIHLKECGQLSCKMIQDMRPKLTAAHLVYDVDASLTDIHPFLVLKDSWDTLTGLVLDYFDAPLPRALYPQPFPLMRELYMGWCDNPGLAPYAYAFPNLHTLGFQVPRDRTDFDVATVMTLRQRNRTDFLRYSPWKTFQSVSGALVEVYISGIACEVGDLSLFPDRTDTLEMLRDILNDAQPTKLMLYAHWNSTFDKETGLPAIFRREAMFRPQDLSLDIDFLPED